MASAGRAGAAKVGKIAKDDSSRLEEETRRMEARLANLRDMVDKDKAPRKDGTRWKTASGQKPLTRGYAQQVLNQKHQRGPAVKPEEVVEKLEEVGEFVKLPDFVPMASLGASAGSAKSAVGARLAQAHAQDTQSAQEVVDFLEGLGLSRYRSLFAEHGFDDMESVLEIRESHMDAMGIAMGHKLKIGKRIRELKPPPTPPQPRGARSSARRAQFSSSPAAEASPAKSPGTTGPSLLDGAYDEEAEAASFRAAVMAWRSGGASEEPAAPEPPVAPVSPGGSFWAKVDAAGWENRDPQTAAGWMAGGDLPERPQSAARSTATESPSRAKAACYRCYAQFFQGAPGTVDRFCSEACHSAHELEAQQQAARRNQLESTQRKLQERIELVDRAQAEQQADPGAAEEPADAVFAPQAVARELLPAM